MLARRALFSKSKVSARKFIATVDYADVQTASAIYMDFRNKHLDRPDQLAPARYDYSIFGTVIGIAVSLAFVFGANHQTAKIAFGFAPGYVFAAFGHLSDRAGDRRTALGRWDLCLRYDSWRGDQCCRIFSLVANLKDDRRLIVS